MVLNRIPTFQDVKDWANQEFNYFDSDDARTAVDNSNVSVGNADKLGGQWPSYYESSSIPNQTGTGFQTNGYRSPSLSKTKSVVASDHGDPTTFSFDLNQVIDEITVTADGPHSYMHLTEISLDYNTILSDYYNEGGPTITKNVTTEMKQANQVNVTVRISEYADNGDVTVSIDEIHAPTAGPHTNPL